MSDLPDPQDAFESPEFEPAIPGDKRIIFGARKPTEEAAPLTGIPPLIEAPFPQERTLHWWPAELPFELNLDGNTAVVVSQEVLVKVNAHVAESLDHELGGFLLGNRYRCPVTSCDYVIIDQYSPAKFTESSEVRLNLTHDAWAQLSDELSGKFLGKLLIGWYHSHPRMDVFLSSHDMEIQTERFPEPWMVALVLEPERNLGGFFSSRNGRVNPNSPVDFFELLERNVTASVIEWPNYQAAPPAMIEAANPANTVEVLRTSSPELPVAITNDVEQDSENHSDNDSENDIEKPAVPKKGRGRLFLAAAVLIVLAGAAAIGFTQRRQIRAWLQSRSIISAAKSPEPTPTPTLDPSPQLTPTAENTSATPQPSSASSVVPAPQASATPGSK
ncbi:MAG TPA: hypothetical protein VJ749_05380 [Pyrinomonadaceae bacterium]|nr:hypothetical protein [Pyrinomonadaceae bacterium]